jgi:hypothetical protein
LTGRENESKQDKPFEEWIKGQNDSFYDRHLIPKDPECHNIEKFDTFLKHRRELIKSELISLLGSPPDPADE